MLANTENKQIKSKSGNDSPILDLNNSAIKSLIKKGKVNGFVTLDELNSALPPGEYSSEQIEDIHAAINDMGLNIIDQQEESSNEEVEEKNSGNLSDDEGARSDDPVRMYLKEMPSPTGSLPGLSWTRNTRRSSPPSCVHSKAIRCPARAPRSTQRSRSWRGHCR